MQVLDLSLPQLGHGMVLVHNRFSLISAGTEGSTVSTARKTLIGKAKERPQQVKQVLDTLAQQGPLQTFRAVMKKLDAHSPLGYSSAGVVIDVAEDVKGFAVGDRVACAGAGYANHAEVIAVPHNLCVKLPETADLGRAAYNTLGAIAMQGVRQAQPNVGETVVVIGLGLLGQLTALILKASGVKVLGIDVSDSAVKIAQAHCVDMAFESNDPAIEGSLLELSNGIGADSVIITAATKSHEPVNQAGRLLRHKGTVVIVGDVPTGFERDPYYYKKELSLKMSCSYGPGRYDLQYEEKGHDYPAGHVRWTENRNMQTFQELIQSGRLDLDYLTTHRFKLEDAPAAYDLIVNRSEPFLGILLEYEANKTFERTRIELARKSRQDVLQDKLAVSFLGAGSYAMSHLLPNISSNSDMVFRGVMTASGASSRTVADKYQFAYCGADAKDIVGDEATDAVFIATRHDTHASYVLESLRAGKHVFVEKPLCMNEQELKQISQEWRQGERLLMVGFNRRFSPLARTLKAAFSNGPMNVTYRVNAGAIPANTWIQDDDIGGGRVVGEVCHFVDFLMYLTGSAPTKLFAAAMKDPENLQDNVSINLVFENGSVGTIGYFANGSKALAKEYVEVFQGGKSATLRDFKELSLYSSREKREKVLNQNKGQADMVAEFIKAARGVIEPPIPYAEIYLSTLVTFKILESLRSGEAIQLPKISG